MKKVELYVCEFCGTQYRCKVDAQECEKLHKKPMEIKTCRYLGKGQDASGYPLEITIRFDDGYERKYSR